MKIEEGKFYRSASGDKIGPMVRADLVATWFYVENRTGRWDSEGVMYGYPTTYGNLVAEWSDGPVREVVTTTREIVPGIYDRLEVKEPDRSGNVRIALAFRTGADQNARTMVLNPKELGALIENLTALHKAVSE